jgi:Tol biopolymer transport system component
MSKLVADYHYISEKEGLRVIDVATGAETPLVTRRSFAPNWSPDGSRIAFVGHPWPERIDIVSADGFAVSTAFTAPGFEYLGRPHWSPDSMTVAFYIYDEWGFPPVTDIYRVPANGGGAVNLTADIPDDVSITGWH